MSNFPENGIANYNFMDRHDTTLYPHQVNVIVGQGVREGRERRTDGRTDGRIENGIASFRITSFNFMEVVYVNTLQCKLATQLSDCHDMTLYPHQVNVNVGQGGGEGGREGGRDPVSSRLGGL